MPFWTNRCLNEDTLVKCIWWKKRGTKGHTNNPAVSALPWSRTPSWDDDIITFRINSFESCEEIWLFFFFFFFFFCPSATWLFPNHLSLFPIFRPLRTFRCIEEESVRGIHKGRYWKEEELHFSCFLSSLTVTFLYKFIVSSELVAARPCVTISVYRKPTKSLFFCPYDHYWSLKTAQRREPLAHFKRSPSTLRSRTTRYSHGLEVRYDTTGFTSKIALPFRS